MRPTILLGVVATSLTLAACGTSGSTLTAAGPSKVARMLAFARCMRSHGVPSFPDPSRGLAINDNNGTFSVNGVAVNGPAFQSGMRACHSELPNGGQPAPLSASRRRAILRWAACMRSHGLSNFPDPTFSGNNLALRFGQTGINANSPAFAAAQAACGSLPQRISPGAGVKG